jgi:hypothetical protein
MDTGSAMQLAGFFCIFIGSFMRNPRLLLINFRESFKQRVEAQRIYEKSLAPNKLLAAKVFVIVGFGLLALGYLMLNKVLVSAAIFCGTLGMIYSEIKKRD